MKQALIIKNPKWEPYNKASAAFADADPGSVLVILSRCKQKKGQKPKTIIAKAAKAVADAVS